MFEGLKPGRTYGLSFGYAHQGAVFQYECRALMTGTDESSNLPVWRTRLASGQDQRLVIPREWVRRCELEKNKPTFMKRVTG